MKKCLVVILFFIAIFGSYLPYLPAKNFNSKSRVVIFVGHTGVGNNFGAKSSSGIYEIVYNDILAKKLASIKSDKFEYVLIDSSQKVKLKNRPDFAAKYKADLIIEIHHDSAQQIDIDVCNKEKGDKNGFCNKMSGASVFFCSKQEKGSVSEKVSLLIGKSLQKNGFRANLYHMKDIKGERRKIVSEENAVYDTCFYVLKNAKVPSVLIEAAVITNPLDEEKVKHTDYHDRFAKSVHEGIEAYFEFYIQQKENKN